MSYLPEIILVGVGATAATDLWTLARKRLLNVPMPDFGLVGRWIGHMPRGRFRHARIAAAARVNGERIIGWSAHYLIGIGFAAALLVAAGVDWLRQPTLLPALLVGICTVLAPFLFLQPGMGAGIASRRAPHPAAARLHSLITHCIFGLGLYASALIVNSFSG